MKWISIKDRSPPNDVYVLIATFDSRTKVEMHFISIAYRMGLDWIDNHDGEKLDPKYGFVTHWMPLPDVPEKE